MNPEVEQQIRPAFADVSLGDGIGLWEGNAIDDYAPRAPARAKDIRDDWSKIPREDLRAVSALCYVDAEGMRFLLPAYIISAPEDIMDFLCDEPGTRNEDRFRLLNQVQRQAIRNFLEDRLLSYEGNVAEVEQWAIQRGLNTYWNEVTSETIARINKSTQLIDSAFAGVTLGDGIGLWEADSCDSLGGLEETHSARARDERQDWRLIPATDIQKCQGSSLHFTDAVGMRFLLPAFMLHQPDSAEFTLCHSDTERFHLLNPTQCRAIVAFLEARLNQMQGNSSQGEQRVIRRALDSYWLAKSQETKGD